VGATKQENDEETMRLERTRDGTLSRKRIDDLYVVDVTKEGESEWAGEKTMLRRPWDPEITS